MTGVKWPVTEHKAIVMFLIAMFCIYVVLRFYYGLCVYSFRVPFCKSLLVKLVSYPITSPTFFPTHH